MRKKFKKITKHLKQILNHSPTLINVKVRLTIYWYSLLKKNLFNSLFWLVVFNFSATQNSQLGSTISNSYQQFDVSLKKVLEIPEEEERHEELKKLGYRIADNDPKRGWDLAATEFDIATDKETFAMALLRQWGSAKPEDA